MATAARTLVKYAGLGCAGLAGLGLIAALALLGLASTENRSARPVSRESTQPVPPLASPEAPVLPCRVVLDVSSAEVTVEPGPPGEPIRVESSYDSNGYEMAQSHSTEASGHWVYRMEFHEKTLARVSVLRTWLGGRSPKVRVVLPKDVPMDLEVTVVGGYFVGEIGGLDLRSADIRLDRGVAQLSVSEPLPGPMDRLSLVGRMGTIATSHLGNASPREFRIQHGMGALLADLRGEWREDATASVYVTFGSGTVRLPDNVRLEGADTTLPISIPPEDDEIPRPTLRLHSHFDIGELRLEQ